MGISAHYTHKLLSTVDGSKGHSDRQHCRNEALTSARLAGAVLVGLLVSWVVLKLVPKADAVSVILYCRTLPP